MRDIKEMRHEVIENAIAMENFLNEIILNSFGMEIEFTPTGEIWENKSEVDPDKMNYRNMFNEYFLSRLNFPSKFKLIKELAKNMKNELYEEFSKEAQKFVEIRNRFAHNIYPDILDQHKKMESYGKYIRQQQTEWENYYLEYSTLYDKITLILFKTFFNEI